MPEVPVYIIDSANRKLKEGKIYEVTHVGNRALGWMLSLDSLQIRITSKEAIFRIIDPSSGLEENVALFTNSEGNPVPRSHNGKRFTDALLGLGECRGCTLID